MCYWLDDEGINMNEGLKKNMEEAVMTWLEELFLYLTRITDANHEETQSGQLVSGPMFNP